MANNKGTFNAGWWNCFYSFASALIDINPNWDSFCKDILSDAGITSKEAGWQLENADFPNPRIEQLVRDYFLNLSK